MIYFIEYIIYDFTIYTLYFYSKPNFIISTATSKFYGRKNHTGLDLESSIEAARTALEESGSPHLSTTFGTPSCLVRASITEIKMAENLVIKKNNSAIQKLRGIA